MKESDARWRTLLAEVDWLLVGIVGAIAAVGILNLSSAAYRTGADFDESQVVWFGLGAVVVAGVCLFDYRFFSRWAYVIFGGVVLLLVGVLAVGTELNGARRWLDFGFFLFQPSEPLKVAVILLAARYFDDRGESEPYTLRELVVPGALVGSAVGLVAAQPDLGTSVLLLCIFVTMVLFEGLDGTSIATLALVGIVAAPVVWNVGMEDYQKERVLAFFELTDEDSGATWQVRQSIVAIGSGRIWGKGYKRGTQVKKGFVPEHENDFVAANWGEEFGLAGMSLLLFLYAAFLGRLLWISSRARDRFGAHVALGVAALVFWHVVFNLGMVTGLLPVAGLTLPLMSYGGSSLLTVLFGVGLALNVGMRRRPLS